MPDGKISDDTAISSLAGSEVIPIVQSGDNKTVTPTQFFSWLEEQNWSPTGNWDFSNATLTGEIDFSQVDVTGLSYISGFNTEHVYVDNGYIEVLILDNGTQKVMDIDSFVGILEGHQWTFSGDMVANGNPYFGFGGADVDFGGANVNFAGANITGLEIYTETHMSGHTLSAEECYGGVHYVESSGIITLPDVAEGMSVSIIAVSASQVSVKPHASDGLNLDGVLLDLGDKATSTSTLGDIITLTYFHETGWYAASNGWTDGGA